jgi:RND superfamily putative drug exporter
MSARLYRLGSFSYRRRRLVALLWLVLLVALGVGAGALKGDYSSQFTIPGTESQAAIDALQQRFPASGVDKASANVVLAAPAGERLDTQDNRAAVAAVLTELRALDHVTSVADPFATRSVSPDGRVALAHVLYDITGMDVGVEVQDDLFATAEPGRAAGLQVEFSGPAAQKLEKGGVGELLGVAVAAVVLLSMFGSALAAGIPLLTAFVGVGVGILVITGLTGFLDLSSLTPVLGLMLGLAVGIDYALFIMTRFRDELLHGRVGADAAGRAVATAGGAVVFAGLTVVIALVGLLTVRIPFISSMGLAAGGTIAVAVLVALTLLPALLGFSGRRVLGRRHLRAEDDDAGPKPTLGHRWGLLVARHPVRVLTAALAVLGVLAVPALSLKTALPDEGALSPDSTNRKAYDLMATAFGPGSNGPLVVVVLGDRATGARAAATVQQELSRLDGAVAVLPPVANPAKDTFLLTVLAEGGPASDETKQLVHRIRQDAPALEERTGTTIAVTGQTAIQVDVTEKLTTALPVYLLLVVGLALLLLTVVFRSVVVPIKAALGFLLTMASTFGAVVALFQWGWLAGPLGITSTGPIISTLPIFMIGVIFGLAMDYQVFLVSRMREEHVHGAEATPAVVDGFRHGARVVSAAAMIMMAVFAAFMLSPDASTKSLGFAFSFGIAVDAFLIRMTVVPAVMVLLGERAWWLPRRLERLVPRVDIEGEGLRVLDEAEASLADPARV